MKIRKSLYCFEKGDNGAFYPYKPLSKVEIEDFVKNNINIEKGIPTYRGERVPSYLYEGEISTLPYFYIQIGVWECVKVNFFKELSFHYMTYSNSGIGMMVLHK